MSSRAPTAIVGRKLQSLDGLRAVAIILVFLHHIEIYIPAVNQPIRVAGMYIAQGWMGVDLFFVLSGFLITGILLDTREANNYFAAFYARRILRIFPLYYVVLTVVILLGSWLNSPRVAATLPLPQDRWLYYCYLANWIGLWKGQWGGVNYLAHFWSLAVEEQFYLFWPLVIWLVRPRSIPWVAGTVAVAAAVMRFAWVTQGGGERAVAFATTSRLDELSIGALCAFLFRDAERMARIRKYLPRIAGFGIGSFLLAVSGMLFFPERAGLLMYGSSPVPHTVEDATLFFADCGGYSLLALGFGALVLLAADTERDHTRMQKFLKSRWLAPIGTYSYGIYVFHVPIIGAAALFVLPGLVKRLRTEAEVVFAACSYIIGLAAVTFVISALSYEFFEKRILRLKRYFEATYAPAQDEAVPNGPAVAQEAIGS
jgi:peptidoglycan/LPS O-acetylase OafA/YrhL